ncbi:PfkB family carbohydrate kinase [Pectinatus frisingensis]|uniref:PfkB family carbohydrate kinase n=1 Tax=Pectinatus frisingensis TaxID=865 RepID=UPI0018C63E0D|nr:PfkB family carbohydrate kinase [Pectinatus frisingensis]
MTKREREILKWICENPLISQSELAEKTNMARSSVAVHISNLAKQGYIMGRGYITRTEPYVVVVGGLNVDIGGYPKAKIIQCDSNPGKITMSLGGVGRNIAHNMSLLGLDVRLLTVFGDDANASKIAASCGELGIDISQALQMPGGRTSTYMFIDDSFGNMQLAISDMEIYKQLTPEFLKTRQRLLNNAQVIVVDTNIPQKSIEWLIRHCNVPVFADPVSTAKAVKLKNVLSNIHTLKPNLIETEILSGIDIVDRKSMDKAIDILLDTGLRRIFVSLGADGVLAADHEHRLMLPCIEADPVDSTGCGDAFMAALVWSYMEGTDLRETALSGLAAASLSIESEQTVNPNLSEEQLKKRMNSIVVQ